MTVDALLLAELQGAFAVLGLLALLTRAPGRGWLAGLLWLLALMLLPPLQRSLPDLHLVPEAADSLSLLLPLLVGPLLWRFVTARGIGSTSKSAVIAVEFALPPLAVISSLMASHALALWSVLAQLSLTFYCLRAWWAIGRHEQHLYEHWAELESRSYRRLRPLLLAGAALSVLHGVAQSLDMVDDRHVLILNAAITLLVAAVAA